MQRITLFVDVILPLAVGDSFTYRVPQQFNHLIKLRCRVIVPFGKNKLYAGLIVKIHEIPPLQYEAKYIEDVIDTEPIITEYQLQFWQWISNYYLCSIGEVMAASLPSGLKLNSETKVLLNPDFKDEQTLNDKEFLIYEALQIKGLLSLTEIAKILNIKNIQPVINQLIKKQAVITEEDVKQRYKPKYETYVTLTEFAANEQNLKKIFNELKTASKQEELLIAYITLSNFYLSGPKAVLKKDLLTRVEGGLSALKVLEKKGIIKTIKQEVGRTLLNHAATDLLCELTEEQNNALKQIQQLFEQQKGVLLWGVTGSGKTEIYFHLIKQCIEQNKQVLFLLPEIALTYQMINRLTKHFGSNVAIYHSRYGANERVEIWNRCLNTQHPHHAKIILGARSALLLPFNNLGLIIVDEEHDQSYKQQDPAPRYNARDMAYILAKQHQAHLLFGSATPCLETIYNAINNKIQLVELNNRYGNIELPEIILVDLKKAKAEKQLHTLFTSELLNQIKTALHNKQQILLFQNRRGFAPYIECADCAEVPMCLNCDISLTYHKNTNNLICHYCGYSTPVPKTCKKCNSTNLKLQGFGTEKVEEELAVFFPEAKIARMDLDSTRNKNAYQQIIADFEEKRIDVLIGTQMITKGLNFDNVSLVGVLNADQLLHYPDFRSLEKAYQLLTQVAGRAGRKKTRGKVIIQTLTPLHPLFQYINKNAWPLINEQLNERKNFFYPPFSRLIQITIKHKNKETLQEASHFLASELRKNFNTPVLGPEFPVISRIFNYFQMQILIKINRKAPINETRKIITNKILELKTNHNYKSCRVVINVDPL
jgi:primosomal protein N' (replication factor Y)